jgi:acyl phosphate:glycerol-3-phosphate acyltransferase
VHSLSPSVAYPLLSLLAYLIGGLPFGYWFVLFFAGRDIRTMGSGNIGATNVHRTLGRGPGVMVLLLDILKGYVAVWLAASLTNNDPIAVGLAAFAVMLGHCYPVFLRFKGGKAVASFVGVFLFISPLTVSVVALIFVAIVAFTKYISLASILCALIFPLLLRLLAHPSPSILIATVFSALLIIYRHRANINRLRTGQEHVFSLRGRTAR